MNDQIMKALNWRYATKQFDGTKKVPEETLNTLLESIRLAPSSFGLQPWKIVVVTNPEVRTKLKAAAWNQAQITDASHLLVFASKTDLDAQYIDMFISVTAKTRGQDLKELDGFRQMLLGSVKAKGPESVSIWNARQAYIALGFLLETAALMGIDACPMEGFDPKQFDEILGLKAKGFTAVALAPIGYRSENDKYAQAPKVRFSKNEIFEMV